jgi:hypothetical protein
MFNTLPLKTMGYCLWIEKSVINLHLDTGYYSIYNKKSNLFLEFSGVRAGPCRLNRQLLEINRVIGLLKS